MTKRVCAKCKQEKPLSEFCKKGKYRLHSYCKPCLYEVQTDRWNDRKKIAIEQRGGKCSKCGYDKNYGALSFHHLDPNEKEFAWNKLRLYSWEKINKELDKCIVVCHNCHAELHYPHLTK